MHKPLNKHKHLHPTKLEQLSRVGTRNRENLHQFQQSIWNYLRCCKRQSFNTSFQEHWMWKATNQGHSLAQYAVIVMQYLCTCTFHKTNSSWNMGLWKNGHWKLNLWSSEKGSLHLVSLWPNSCTVWWSTEIFSSKA